MSSPGGMCEQGSGMSRNQLFLSLFAIKWTAQEIVLSSINFKFSWTIINIKTKLVLPPAAPLFCLTVSSQAGTWGFPLHGGAVSPLHLPLPQKVSKGAGKGQWWASVSTLWNLCASLLWNPQNISQRLERDCDGCGFLLYETCGLLLYKSCV